MGGVGECFLEGRVGSPPGSGSTTLNTGRVLIPNTSR